MKRRRVTMNQLLESGKLQEIECGRNFAYILAENAEFLSTDYKVLQSQQNNNFIPCMRMFYNGKTQLFYLMSRGLVGWRHRLVHVMNVRAKNYPLAKSSALRACGYRSGVVFWYMGAWAWKQHKYGSSVNTTRGNRRLLQYGTFVTSLNSLLLEYLELGIDVVLFCD